MCICIVKLFFFSITTKSCSPKHPVNNTAANAVSASQPTEPVEPTKNCIRTSTVSSSLKSESSEEDKATYETSV